MLKSAAIPRQFSKGAGGVGNEDVVNGCSGNNTPLKEYQQLGEQICFFTSRAKLLMKHEFTGMLR